MTLSGTGTARSKKLKLTAAQLLVKLALSCERNTLFDFAEVRSMYNYKNTLKFYKIKWTGALSSFLIKFVRHR